MAIDFHAHPITLKEALEKDDRLLENVMNVFRLFPIVQPTKVLIKSAENAGIDKTVLLPIDCEIARGCTLPSNTIISNLVEHYPDRFIGFASVDPNKGDSALKALDFAVNELKLKGLKLYPSLQNFCPSDSKIYPFYKKAMELDIPVLFHAGTSWAEGKDALNDVMYLDDVAYNFPKLRIVIAHFGWPKVWETVCLAVKYDNVFIDFSGLPSGFGLPHEHFELVFRMVPKKLFQRCLIDKVVFGSDFPRTDVSRMASALKSFLPSKDVEEKLMQENAARVLNLK
ncbi:amidohydrolase [Candidatus Bathyarchaeota archaeon]|nr:amidohydrolase [Candidatus Bathyarchaeota archaeon]